MSTVAFRELGIPGFLGASRDRLLQDWTAEDQDANEIWNADWTQLGGRSADLGRNNAYAVAMLNAMAAGVIGSDGLSFRSLYQADRSDVTSPGELALRREIQAAVENAFAGKSLDAAGLLGASPWVRMAKIQEANGLAGEWVDFDHVYAFADQVDHGVRVCNP